MNQLQEAIRDKITKYSDACGMCTDTTEECDTCSITCMLEDLNELQKLANNPDAIRPTAHIMRGTVDHMKKQKLAYRGYAATVEYDEDDKLWHGTLDGIKDLVNFHAFESENIEQEFHNAVDDYLDFCKKVGKEPERSKMSEWISVKDRLPDVFDVVLVYSDGFISISWRETEKRKNGIVCWHWNSYPDSLGYVTHWMPLPKPPEVTP